MGKNVYSSETKWVVVKDKLTGQLTHQEMMEKYGIKNDSQIKTWMRRYRNNEMHSFDQPIGKQYTYGHRPKFASEMEKKDRQNAHLKMENDILKKYLEIKKELERE